MASASELISEFTSMFDESRTRALALLNDRYKRMVTEANWFTKEASLGTTVAGTDAYAVAAGIEDLRAVYVGAERYVPVGMEELRSLHDPNSGNWASGPAYAEDYDSNGALMVRLWPVPSSSGVTITAIYSSVPADLVDTTGSIPAIPTDLHHHLRDGLVADGYLYVDERTEMAQLHDERFREGIMLLKKRKNSRMQSGPSQLSVTVAGR